MELLTRLQSRVDSLHITEDIIGSFVGGQRGLNFAKIIQEIKLTVLKKEWRRSPLACAALGWQSLVLPNCGSSSSLSLAICCMNPAFLPGNNWPLISELSIPFKDPLKIHGTFYHSQP